LSCKIGDHFGGDGHILSSFWWVLIGVHLHDVAVLRVSGGVQAILRSLSFVADRIPRIHQAAFNAQLLKGWTDIIIGGFGKMDFRQEAHRLV